MLQAVRSVNGTVLWTNLHLLFWLSLIPFVTGWMGENHFSTLPVFCYGVVLLMNGVAYAILVNTLIKHHGKNSLLAHAFGNDFKGKISVAIYAVALAVCWFNTAITLVLYVVVAGIWFVPDKRIETKLAQNETEDIHT